MKNRARSIVRAETGSTPGGAASSAMVLYAIDNSPRYAFLVERSLSTLRARNTTIPVRVAIFGSARALDLAGLRRLGAEVVVSPRVEEPGLLKWYALARLDAESVLYLDADTLVSRDPKELFDRYADSDVYGRRQIAGARDSGAVLVGGRIFHPHVRWPTLEATREAIDAGEAPLFDTGVLLLRRSAHRALRHHLYVARDLCRMWRSGKLPHPTRQWSDEPSIAAMLMLGVSGLRCGLLDAADCPFYTELLANDCDEGGIVTHVWREYYRFHLQRRAPRDLSRYDLLFP